MLPAPLKRNRFTSLIAVQLLALTILAGCSGGDTVALNPATPETAMYMGGVFQNPEFYQYDCPDSCPASPEYECGKECIVAEKDRDRCNAQVYTRQEKMKHAEKIASSKISTLIYMFLHFYPDGSLYLNGTPLVYQDGSINLDIAFLRDLFKTVKAGGKKKVLLSIGGWHTSDYTFSRIQTSMKLYPNNETNPYFRNLLAAKQFFQFDGIDLDYEPDSTVNFIRYDDTYAQLLADITRWAYSNGMVVTCAPYKDTDFWKKVIAKTVADNGRQMISRMNVQFYDGGGDNNYQDWYEALTDPVNHVYDMDRFLSVGYNQKSSPSGVQKKLADIKNGVPSNPHPAFNGAFLYQYSDIISYKCGFDLFDKYDDALVKGVSGIVPAN